LNKRTSINSILKIHKEKEMADFRKLLYAFAFAALGAALSAPASAQTTLMTCTGTANNPVIRAEGFTELSGDVFITCNGGQPTASGQLVPKVNITVFVNAPITSKITDASVSPAFNEALLIVDEAGSVGSGNALLNCGNALAPYSTTTPFTCDIYGTGTGAGVYTGAPAGGGNAARPNVFQGRQVSTGSGTAIQFIGVPIDPPGNNGLTGAPRTLRITNLRVNAVSFGVSGSGSFNLAASVQTSVTFNGTNFGGSQVVNVVNGTVRTGLLVSSARDAQPANFLQCTATSGNAQNDILITEGFPSAFKVRNWALIQANGIPPSGSAGWAYAGTTNNAIDVNQNVPNALYNTESGLMFPGGPTVAPVANPVPGNPPPGTGPSGAAPAATAAFSDATNGGIDQAGVVSQGTRIAIQFGAVPAGSGAAIPNKVFLTSGGVTTGVMVLVNGTDAAGAGGTLSNGAGSTLISSLTNGLAVYEVLYDDPSSLETAKVTVTVAPTINLGATPSTPAVSPAMVANSVGFAPFYPASSAAGSAAPMAPTATSTGAYPIPRFVPSNASAITIFQYSTCACNLLFPWVVGDSTFTTSIVVANTSQDPGASNGFSAAPQTGPVTFWYFGTKDISLDPTQTGTWPSQTTTVSIPAGSYAAHIVSTGAAGNTPANGLKALPSPFAGYVIAQAAFQYCHGVASISSNVPGFGVQTYIGLTLDKPVYTFNGAMNGAPITGTISSGDLPRTTQTLNDGLEH
jgi:hypothetical protein